MGPGEAILIQKATSRKIGKVSGKLTSIQIPSKARFQRGICPVPGHECKFSTFGLPVSIKRIGLEKKVNEGDVCMFRWPEARKGDQPYRLDRAHIGSDSPEVEGYQTSGSEQPELLIKTSKDWKDR
jgi:hypothetical protein